MTTINLVGASDLESIMGFVASPASTSPVSKKFNEASKESYKVIEAKCRQSNFMHRFMSPSDTDAAALRVKFLYTNIMRVARDGHVNISAAADGNKVDAYRLMAIGTTVIFKQLDDRFPPTPVEPMQYINELQQLPSILNDAHAIAIANQSDALVPQLAIAIMKKVQDRMSLSLSRLQEAAILEMKAKAESE